MSQPEPTNIAAVLQLMATLGVTADDLGTVPCVATTTIPTVAEYYEVVTKLATPGQQKTYANHWASLKDAYGEKRLNELRKSDLDVLAKQARSGALQRANSRGGRGAEENCVAALRHFFTRAVDDEHLRESPAAKVEKPRRQPSHRRPLRPAEVEQLWNVTATTGNDPALDTLLFRFHLETGARRGGALALRLSDLNHQDQTVLLREKNETERWCPVSKTLLDALVEHAEHRGATERDDAVFRYKPQRGKPAGSPLTYRRYDNIYERWRAAFPWAAKVHVSGHWLRHTAVAEVEKLAGFGTARKFAGHRDESAATTLTYIRGSDEDVARAASLRTGESHPLVPDAEDGE